MGSVIGRASSIFMKVKIWTTLPIDALANYPRVVLFRPLFLGLRVTMAREEVAT